MKSIENNKEGILYPRAGTTQRVISGSFYTILGEGIGAIKHILLVPLFLWAWGKLVYGEWLTIYALVAYLPLVDLGVHNYIVNRLTQSYSRGELKEYTKIFHSSLRLYLTIVTLCVPIFAIFVFLTPISNWLNITITNENIVKIAVFILGTYLLLSLPLGLITGLYHSLGEYSRRAMLTNIHQISLIGLLALVLFFKGSFLAVSAIFFIPMLGLVSFVLYDIKRRHPEIRFGFSSADWKLSLSFIGPGFLFSLVTLASALKIQGSILVISVSLSAGAVVIFSIHRTLAHLIFKITGSIKNAVWPEMTAIEAVKDFTRIRLGHNFLIKLTLFSSVSFSVFLFFAGKDIIRIWTQDKIVFQSMLWILLLMYLPFNCLWEMSGLVQLSTNKHKTYSLCRISSAILGLVLAVILTKIWGIVGTLLGFIIAELVICWRIPLETLKIIKVEKLDFLLNTIGKGLFIIIPQVLIGWILSCYVSNIFLQWGLLILGIFSIGGIIGYLFWLTDEERKRSSQLINVCLWK